VENKTSKKTEKKTVKKTATKKATKKKTVKKTSVKKVCTKKKTRLAVKSISDWNSYNGPPVSFRKKYESGVVTSVNLLPEEVTYLRIVVHIYDCYEAVDKLKILLSGYEYFTLQEVKTYYNGEINDDKNSIEITFWAIEGKQAESFGIIKLAVGI